MVLDVADEEIKETAELLSRTSGQYDLVVGGNAAERVAKSAGVAGDLCRSIADPALTKSLSDDASGWHFGRQPSNPSTWLDVVESSLSLENYTKDKAEVALRHSFATIKADVQLRRGARSAKRQRVA